MRLVREEDLKRQLQQNQYHTNQNGKATRRRPKRTQVRSEKYGGQFNKILVLNSNCTLCKDSMFGTQKLELRLFLSFRLEEYHIFTNIIVIKYQSIYSSVLTSANFSKFWVSKSPFTVGLYAASISYSMSHWVHLNHGCAWEDINFYENTNPLIKV